MRVAFEIFLVGILIFAVSCGGKDDISKKPLPPHIADSISTGQNDISPAQMPLKQLGCNPCESEFAEGGSPAIGAVYPSHYFLKDIFDSFIPEEKKEDENFNYDYFIKDNAETISFVNDSSGFFSISHLPDRISSEILSLGIFLPMDGHFGGTDLYEFKKEGGKYEIDNLGENFNTIFWDSHPFAVRDSNCNTLLLWASDRNSPYSYIVNPDGSKEKTGHTDLYYSFRDSSGMWSPARAMDFQGTGINTHDNEESPFLYCACYAPKLFFASNRAGMRGQAKDYDDYDIYYIDIEIDFDKKEISPAEGAVAISLPKGPDGINTSAKELFPYISKPYSEEAPENYLFLSSGRYSGNDGQYQNKGGLDIYRFPLNEIQCRPPKIFYHYVILDSTNPGARVKSPIVNFYETKNGEPELIETDKSHEGVFELKPWRSYQAEGGSHYKDIPCVSGKDSVLWYYQIRKVSLSEIDTLEEIREIQYKKIAPVLSKRLVDTVFNIRVSENKLAEIQANRNKKIVSALFEDGEYYVEFRQKLEITDTLKYDTVKAVKKAPVKYTRPVFDTVFTKSGAGNMNQSLITKSKGRIRVENISEDTHIYDTIYVWPKYYHYPPCEWKYVKQEVDYRRNVPYFQTCFWEVNTVENLKKHILELQRSSSRLGNASFIELHPKNHYFGFKREGISSGEYWARYNKYLKYAAIVDSNIADMTGEIGSYVLPAFRSYDSLVPENNNKIIIMIDAYSDIRPIGGNKAKYLPDGGNSIEYLAVSYDTANYRIKKTYPVIIPPNAPLTGKSNDTLSKLRVYYGYREILKRLMNYPAFKQYFEDGKVLLPDSVSNEIEFWRKFLDSKIVVVIEGKQFDPTVTPGIEGYKGIPGDYEILDTVRRINVSAQRVVVEGRNLSRPDCCKDPPPHFIEGAQIKNGKPEGIINRGDGMLNRRIEKLIEKKRPD